MRSEGVRKMPIRTYECPHCDGWHLTSQAASYLIGYAAQRTA